MNVLFKFDLNKELKSFNFRDLFYVRKKKLEKCGKEGKKQKPKT